MNILRNMNIIDLAVKSHQVGSIKFTITPDTDQWHLVQIFQE